MDFGEFRIMIVVQMCILIKVGIRNWHLDLHNLVYPVAKLGAAKQLEHIDVEERPYVQSLILRETGLEKFGSNKCRQRVLVRNIIELHCNHL
jgi:hypothetical protein